MDNRRRSGRGARSHRDAAGLAFEQALLGDVSEGRKRFDPRSDRKTLQLCRQVERALSLALAGECGDDLLREVWVEGVEPMGGAGALLVRVCVPRGIVAVDVVARLNHRAGALRSIVAGSICRKKVPSLSFVAVPGNGTETGNDNDTVGRAYADR